MLFLKKYKIIDNNVFACDYEYILDRVVINNAKKKFLLICPIASQTLVLSHQNKALKKVLDRFDFIVPCSEWVKRSINFLYGAGLKNRVYGPNLMLKICALSVEKKYKIFLYGNTRETLQKLNTELRNSFHGLKIVGTLPSKFAPLTLTEKNELIKEIEMKKADILFIGLGSPLQEVFTYDLLINKPILKKPLTIVTVGASFDFISKVKPQAPHIFQATGLEWLFRLMIEPVRLWKRYLLLGPLFILLILRQKFSLLNFGNYIVTENKIRR